MHGFQTCMHGRAMYWDSGRCPRPRRIGIMLLLRFSCLGLRPNLSIECCFVVLKSTLTVTPHCLPRHMLMVHPEAAAQCHLYGGYLAELDDKAEFDAVRQFTKLHNPDNSYVALGGTDYHHEGNWTLEETGKPMNYTNFYPGEPNAVAGEDCLYLSEYYRGKMVNYYCFTLGWMRFLCEIPADATSCPQ